MSMAKNGGNFEGKCSCCGTVKIDGEWCGTMFLKFIKKEIFKKLPETLCPWCLMARTYQQNMS
jgi:hypothetical protein